MPHAGTCAFSILLSAAERDFDIIFLTVGLTEENRLKVNRLASIFNASIHLYEADHVLDKLRPINKDHERYRAAHLSDAALLRIFYADLLHKEYEKIVYVDCDVVFVQDAGFLFREHLNGYIIGAVPDLIANQVADSQDVEIFNYFNSGVLFIDDRKWRAAHVQDHLLKIMQDSDPGQLKYPDQDILNIYFRRIGYKKVSCRLNYQYMVATDKILMDSDIPIEEAIVIHFAGKIKPWHQWSPSGYAQIYSRFRLLSPWSQGYSPSAPENIHQACIGFQALVGQARYQEACVYANAIINSLAKKF